VIPFANFLRSRARPLNAKGWHLRRAFREQLLVQTVQHARSRIPAYGRLFRHLAAVPKTVPELATLPIIDKAMMLAEPDQFRDAQVPTAITQKTGGTTGTTLYTERGRLELEFIQRFFSAVTPNASGAPVIISALGQYNGTPTPLPYPAAVHNVALDDPPERLMDLVMQAKSSSAAPLRRRRAALVGLESHLRALTCRLLERGVDLQRTAVGEIVSTGDFVTARLRSWYECTWGAPLHDRFTMSEIFGGASACKRCRAWHFDPYVIPEVVHPRTRRVVTTGFGVLVLTSLHPFVQKQPFIRYWTGDLVSVSNACAVDKPSVVFNGRMSRSVVDVRGQRPRPLITASDIYDVLDDLPDVASSEMFPVVKDVADRSALGHLKFTVQPAWTRGGSCREIRIAIELRYPPYLYQLRCSSLKMRLTNALLARHPYLRELVLSGRCRLQVDFALPGTLRSFMPDETE
jgi:hypothetical protein